MRVQFAQGLGDAIMAKRKISHTSAIDLGVGYMGVVIVIALVVFAALYLAQTYSPTGFATVDVEPEFQPTLISPPVEETQSELEVIAPEEPAASGGGGLTVVPTPVEAKVAGGLGIADSEVDTVTTSTYTFTLTELSNTTNFTTAGSFQFTVPANVETIQVKVWGAGGGGGGGGGASGAIGGGGAGGGFTQGNISVSEGDVFNISVGGAGAGGTDEGIQGEGAGGGGFSRVVKSDNGTINIMAGGGAGGAGAGNANTEDGGAGGAGGGANGNNGERGTGAGACDGGEDIGDNGEGATTTAGGAAGDGCTGRSNGAAGTSFQGGGGGDSSVGGNPGTQGSGAAGGQFGGGNGGDGLGGNDGGGGGAGGGFFGGGGGESGANQAGGGGGGGSGNNSGVMNVTTEAGNNGTTGAGTGGTAANDVVANGWVSPAGNGGAGGDNVNGASGNDGRVMVIYTVGVSDALAPVVTLNAPANNSNFSQNEVITFNWTAIDNTDGSLSCDLTINNTVTNASVASANNTNVSVKLNFSDPGDRFWNVTCVDDSTNTNTSATRTFTILDLQAPAWSNNISDPASPVIYSATSSHEFNVTWADNIAVDIVQIEHNFTSTLVNVTLSGDVDVYNFTFESLAVGGYVWRQYANDTSGNDNNTDTFEYVVQQAVPEINITVLPTDTMAYGQTANASCSANTTQVSVNLFRNGTTVSNPDLNVLAAGAYNYTCSTSGDQNFTSVSEELIVTVNRAPAEVNLLINGIDGDVSSSNGSIVNFTATLENGTGNLDLFLNGTLLLSGTSPLEDLSNISVEGLHNVNLTLNESENFTSVFETHSLTVTAPSEIAPNVSLLAPANNTQFNDTQTVIFQWIATDDLSASFTCDLVVDGIVNTSNATQNNTQTLVTLTTLEVGSHTWLVNCTDGTNVNNSETRTFSINDTLPPSITSVNTSEITNISARINWTTDELSNSTVLYGTSLSLTLANGSSTFVTAHSIVLVGLDNNTQYFYNVSSCDGQLQCNVTGTFNFTTDENIDTTVPVITNQFIFPRAVILGKDVTLGLGATDDHQLDTIAANITVPNGTVLTIALNTTFTTTQEGQHNVTFYANDTAGNSVVGSDTTFIAGLAINFTKNLSDANGNAITVIESIYFPGTEDPINSSIIFTGTITQELPDTLQDILFDTHSSTLSVRFRSVNLSLDNQSTGMDLLPTPVNGFLVSYGVNSSLNFTTAEVHVAYNGSSFSTESNLKIDVCSQWDFSNRTCLGSFTEITNRFQNTSGDYFLFNVSSFSGFSIREETAAAPAPTGGGGGVTRQPVVPPTIEPVLPLPSCDEDWSCGDWSSCIDETQTRTCRDANACGTVTAKPDEVQSCPPVELITEEPIVVPVVPLEISQIQNLCNSASMVSDLLLILAVVLLVFLVMQYLKGKRMSLLWLHRGLALQFVILSLLILQQMICKTSSRLLVIIAVGQAIAFAIIIAAEKRRRGKARARRTRGSGKQRSRAAKYLIMMVAILTVIVATLMITNTYSPTGFAAVEVEPDFQPTLISPPVEETQGGLEVIAPEEPVEQPSVEEPASGLNVMPALTPPPTQTESAPSVVQQSSVAVAQSVLDKIDEQPMPVIIILKPGSGGLSIASTPTNKELAQNVLNGLQLKTPGTIQSVYDLELSRTYNSFAAISGELTQYGLQKLQDDPRVVAIYEDRPVQAALSESVDLIRASPDIWGTIVNGTNLTGAGQTVCVIDSGVAYNHSAFGSCSNATFQAGGCPVIISGFDYCGDDQNCATASDDNTDPFDENGHGTHVSGTIASRNETYRGVAPDSQIVALRALNDSGGGTFGSIAAAIDWCTSNASKFNITVISMSLGDGGQYNSIAACPEVLNTSINAAFTAGIHLVAASGNDGFTAGIGYPACSQNVTSVGSTNDGSLGTTADDVSSFTNQGTLLDFFAPGKWITAPVPQGSCELCDSSEFKTIQGTSMATPHVSGAIVLLKQYYALKEIDVNQTDINEKLNETGKIITTGVGNFVRIDIFNAVSNAIGNLSNVSSNIQNLNVTVNASNYNFTNGTNTFVTFSLNETVDPLNFSQINITIEEQGATRGAILVKGVDLNGTGRNKTVYLNKILGSGIICIKDQPIDSLDELSSGCNAADEVQLPCPGSSGPYICTETATQYIISGLNHSGAEEISGCGNITNNSILVANVSSDSVCFTIVADNVTLDCDGFTINYSMSSSGVGVNVTGRTNVTIKNCDIVQANQFVSSDGIRFSGTTNSTIQNNTISDVGGTASSGIELSSSSNRNLIVGNTITTNTTGILLNAVLHNRVENNTVRATVGVGINTGNVGGVSNNTVIGNDAASVSGSGISIVDTFNEILINNIASSSSGDGLRLSSGGDNNTIINLTASSDTGAAVNSAGSTKNNLINTTLFTNQTWIQVRGVVTLNITLNNTLFVSGNGSIRIPGTVNANITNISLAVLNISLNRSFMNATNLSFMNRSAEITLDLSGLGFGDADPVVDFDDDGTFETCAADVCTEQIFNNQIFIFNVSHWTTFAAQAVVSACGTITESTTLINDVSSSGSCLNITGHNLTLDCQGFSIIYDSSGTSGSHGIQAIDKQNITIQNCIVLDDGTRSDGSPGINFTNVTVGRILDTHIETNGTQRDAAIIILNSTLIHVENASILKNGTSNGNGGISITGTADSNITESNINTNGLTGGAIVLTDVDNLLISNNNISTDATNTFSSSASGISLNEHFGNRLLNNTIRTNGAGEQNRGIIIFAGSNHTIIANNTIVTGGTTNNDGIMLFSDVSNVTVSGNNITTNGSSSDNRGIELGARSTNSTISGNTIVTDGTIFNIGISAASDSDFVTIKDNTITTNGSSGSNFGIQVFTNQDNTIISGNTITTKGTGSGTGINLGGAGNTTIANNTIDTDLFASGSGAHGILVSLSQDTLIEGNVITTRGAAAHGIRFFDRTYRNNVSNNNVTTLGTGSYGIFIDRTNTSFFNGTILKGPTEWINSSVGSLNNFSNTTFLTGNGSVQIVPRFQLNSTSVITHAKLNVTLNRMFMNATNLTFMNTSAEITLNLSGLGFGDADPVVDFDDDGTFETCPADVCTEQDFSNSIHTFNVSHWTTFAAQEGDSGGPGTCGTISISTTLTQDVTDTGTCYSIVGDGVVLDCDGFKITFDTSGSGLASGVSAADVQNIEVRNCFIQDGNAGGSTGIGINFTTVNSSTVYNNTIITNGTTANYGVRILDTTSFSHDNNIINNTIRTRGTGASNYGVYFTNQVNRSNITDNVIITNGTSNNYGVYIAELGATDNIVDNNTITTRGTGADNYGIYIHNNVLDTVVSRNTISTRGTSANYGVRIRSASNDTQVIDNTITTDGTSSNHGIFVRNQFTFQIMDGTNITGNTITATGTSFSQNGVLLQSNVINSTVEANHITAGGTNTQKGVHSQVGSLHTNNAILNNIIIANGTVGSGNIGVQLTTTHNDKVINNTIFADGQASAHWGLYINGGNNTQAANNTISTDGVSTNYGVRLVGTNNTLINNTIRTAGSGNQNYGISGVGEDNTSIIDNRIFTSGSSSDNRGIVLGQTDRGNNVEDNIIVANGSSTGNDGIFVGSTGGSTIVSNNSFINNTITAHGTSQNHGIAAAAFSENNTFTDNRISVLGRTVSTTSFAIDIAASNNSVFSGTRFIDVDNWINTGSAATSNNFTNTIFNSTNGSITFGDFILNGTSNELNLSSVNISTNRARVDSNFLFLNTSATIALNLSGQGFSDPDLKVDFEDDGSFVACPVDVCTEQSFINDISTFNVSHWTTFESSEIFDCGTITTSQTIASDITSGGTCITFGAPNITLNCDGNTITYGTDGNNFSVGVNASDVANVTIVNCNIVKGNSTDGAKSYGILLKNASGANVANNAITTNGSTDNVGIYAVGQLAPNDFVSPVGANLNNPVCDNSTGLITGCQVCYNGGGVDCAVLGQTACTDGEGYKSSTLLNFTLPTSALGGTITVIGGENVICELNQNNIIEIHTRNNCGTLATQEIPASAFNVGANNLTCFVAGSGEEEDNAFKLVAFSVDTISGMSNATLDGNRITSDGGNNSHGIFLSVVNSTVLGNNITTLGDTDGHGVYLDSPSQRNTVEDNIVLTTAPGSDALHVYRSLINTFLNNTLNGTRTAGHIEGALNNIFSQSVFPGPRSLFLTVENGDINYTATVNLSVSTNLSEVVDITENETFVNASDPAGDQLNESAQLTFKALTYKFTQAQSLVDFQDDDSFEGCISPQCTELNYNQSTGIFVYNVSGFTTYSAIEASTCGTLDRDFNVSHTTYVLNNNVSSTGTCFTIVGDNITLDCAGLPITFDTSGQGNVAGILMEDTVNVTIKNCFIQDGNIAGSDTIGIDMTNASYALILNNTVIVNGTLDNYGIYLESGANGNVIQENNVSVVTSSISNFGVYMFTTVSGNRLINNTFAANGTSFNRALRMNVNVNNNTISDNTLSVSGTGTANIGMYCDSNCHQNNITNNTIITNGTSTGVGINFASGANYNRIEYNVVRTVGTGGGNVAINLDDFDSGNVTNNTLFTFGTSSGNDGIFLDTFSSFNLIGENTIVTDGSSDNDGITVEQAFGTQVLNNHVTANGTFGGNEGVFVTLTNAVNIRGNVLITDGSSGNNGIIFGSGSDFSNVTNNSITTSGTSSSNRGISISNNADGHIVTNNTIVTGGSSANYGIELGGSFSNDNVISGNSIATQGTGNTNYGIYVSSITASGNQFSYNSITTSGTNDNYGLHILGDNNTFSFNNISTNGSSNDNYGIYIRIGARNNVSNNIIVTNGSATSHGVRLDDIDFGGKFEFNNFSTSGRESYGVLIDPDANGTQFNNTIFNSVVEWISAGSGSINNFTNISLYSAEGLIRFPERVLVNGTRINKTNLNISFNAARVNTSNLSAFNITAFITLDITSFGESDPIAIVDFEDTGTFETCAEDVCTNLSYNLTGNELFEFNVSHWTTFAAQETSACGSISESTILINNVSSSGNCFSISTDNIILNCDGFAITGAGGTGTGVNIEDVNNITIENCFIQGFLRGMDFNNGTNSTARNNTMFNNTRGFDMRGNVDLKSAIENNTIDSSATHGVYISLGTNVTVFGNTIIDSGQWGVRMDVASNTIRNNNFTRSGLSSFDIEAYNGAWQHVGAAHFRARYTQKVVALPAGTTIVRLTHSGSLVAHLDEVVLDGAAPITATDLSDGSSIDTAKLVSADNDIISAHDRTIELTWANAGTSLTITASEENDFGIPLEWPDATFLEYTLGDSKMFTYEWAPVTSHPDSTLYAEFSADSASLHVSLDVTPDNTEDPGFDWAEIRVNTANGVKAFRINSTDTTYGIGSFVYNDRVSWEHKIYEFDIPLSEIEASLGDTIEFKVGVYGTAGSIEDACIFLNFGDYSVVENNTCTNSEHGIEFRLTVNSTIANNTLIDGQSNGLFIQVDSWENTFTNNQILGNWTNGIRIDTAPRQLFINNTISTDNRAIYLFAEDTQFVNTTIRTNATWIFDDGSGNVTFNNTIFETGNGSIHIAGNMTIFGPGQIQTNISQIRLGISLNNSFLNATNLSFMNTSAIITLEGLSFTDADTVVDFDNDGTFESCPTNVCTNVSYDGSTFVFNVSHWTIFAAQEFGVAGPTACGTITTSTTLVQNVTSTGTCYTIGADNMALDCDGNSIFYDSGGTGEDGVVAFGRTNITVKNCFIQDVNVGGAGGHGIVFNGTNSSLAFNNTIFTNGTTNNHGIEVDGHAVLNRIEDNNISTTGSSTFNHGIHLIDHVSDTNITGNIIATNGSGLNDGIRLTNNVSDVIVRSNTINTSLTGANNHGVNIQLNGSRNLVENNTIIASPNAISFGVRLQSASIDNDVVRNDIQASIGVLLLTSGQHNNISFNKIVANGTGSNNIGIVLQSGASHNRIADNNITADGSLGDNDGIRFTISGTNNTIVRNRISSNGTAESSGISISGSTNNIFIANNITARGTNSYAVEFLSVASSSNFTDNIFNDPVEWIVTGSIASGNNFTNTTFVTASGEIRFDSTIEASTSLNLTHDDLNLTQAKARLNASNVTEFNSTAFIAFTGLSFGDAEAVVDFDEDGTNTTCPADVCTNVSYDGSTFVFNVSHWTIFAAQEFTGGPTNCGPLTSSTTVAQDLSSAGTCYTFIADDIELDCDGFSIIGDGTGIGINSTGRDNITIRNCVIANFTNDILLDDTNNSFVINNTATNTSAEVIDIDSSNFNIIVNNTAVSEGGTGISLASSTNNNLTENNATSVSGVGILLSSSSTSNNLTNNIGESSSNRGIFLSSSGSNRLVNNLGKSSSSQGILLQLSSSNVLIGNTAASASNVGLLLLTNANTNNLTGTNASSDTSTGIQIQISSNNFLNSTTIATNTTWIVSAGGSGNSLENTFFTAASGSIRTLPNVTLSATVALANLNITFNRAKLNSTALGFLNTSSLITLTGLSFTNAEAVVDFDEDGTNVTCPADVCTNVSYDGSTFVFNVSHWTIFAAQEQSVFNSNITNCTITDSTVINSDKTNCFITNSTITGSTNTDSNITNSTEINSTDINTTVTDSWIIDSFKNSSTIDDSNITNSTLIDCLVINSTVIDSIKMNCTIINSIIIGSNNNNTFINNSNETNSNDVDTIVINSSITDSTKDNNQITNCTIDNSTIIDSTLSDCTVSNCTVINSTVTGSASDCFLNSTTFPGVVFNTSGVTLDKADNIDPVVVQTSVELNYTITVNSTGTGTAFNVTVVETYPSSVTFNSASPSPTGANDTFSIGNLTSGAVFVINISVNVSTGVADGASLSNFVNASFQNESNGTQFATDTETTTASNPSAAPPPGGGGPVACTDECTFGDISCSGDSVINCRTDVDADVCTEWEYSDCGSGNTCSSGSCVVKCIEDWDCGSWSACDGFQTRFCNDDNSCGTVNDMPADIRSCIEDPPVDVDEEEEEELAGILPDGANAVCGSVVRQNVEEVKQIKSTVNITHLIPQGFRLASKPFHLTCLGDDVDLTVTVPDTFTDLEVLRCTEDQCSIQKTTKIDKTEQVCGNITLRSRTRRKLLERRGALDPETLETFISFYKPLHPGDNTVSEAGYSLEVQRPMSARIGSVRFPVPQPDNPGLAIVGTPIHIQTQNVPDEDVQATITMPLEQISGVDPATIQIYAIVDNTYVWLNGRATETGDISTTVPRLQRYLNGSGDVVFLTTGITCTACTEAIFERVYQSPGTRDAVILVHGVFSDERTWEFMLDDFKANAQPYDAWTFSYPSSKGLEELGTELADAINSISVSYDRFYLVGHSAGGLVIEQALFTADERGDSSLKKVRKAILVGTPGEGSPAIEAITNLFNSLINQRTIAKSFNLNAELLQASIDGVDIPRVRGIDYQVVAGTRGYDFNKEVFDPAITGLAPDIENDGIITTLSAQKVGEKRVDDLCKNYYELDLTHTDLIDNNAGIRVIESIITEDIGKSTAETPLLGQSQYVRFGVTNCQPQDQYAVIGIELREEKAFDPTGCACGNGWCGEGENTASCPSDCARIATVENFCVGMPLAAIILLLAVVLVGLTFATKHYIARKIINPKWLYGGTFGILAAIVFLLVQEGICRTVSTLLITILAATAIAFAIMLMIERTFHRFHSPKGPLKHIDTLLQRRSAETREHARTAKGNLEEVNKRLAKVRRKLKSNKRR